ncbi:unnamed protein product [Peronospora belbahrii]|nr:unnamed protein product [Peronospora belbahrii]
MTASWGHYPPSSHAGSSSESEYDKQAFNNEENDEDEEESTASDSEAEDFNRGTRRRQRIHFNVERLQTVYHLPLKTAAERLGICEAALKRICRRNLIQKWPYRQLSSVRRRITELNDRRVGIIGQRGVGKPGNDTLCEFQDHLPSVTPEQFNIKLQQLQEEQDQIIRLAHQPRRLAKSVQSSMTISCQQYPKRLQSEKRLIVDEALRDHVMGVQSTIADLPPLDLSRVDRDFPLLFLANVCESVRAYQ